jgi:hypothetical protein
MSPDIAPGVAIHGWLLATHGRLLPERKLYETFSGKSTRTRRRAHRQLSAFQILGADPGHP